MPTEEEGARIYYEAIVIDLTCPLLLNQSYVDWCREGRLTAVAPTLTGMSGGATHGFGLAGGWLRYAAERDDTIIVRQTADIVEARALAVLGDTVTTDHISPAGAIPEAYPAGRYLIDQGVAKQDFNSYGSRRGNHEVMMRGTFGNIRIRNKLADGKEGSYTITVEHESFATVTVNDVTIVEDVTTSWRGT